MNGNQAEIQAAIARTALFNGLARAFDYPDAMLAEDIRSGTFLNDIRESIRLCGTEEGLASPGDDAVPANGETPEDLLLALEKDYTRMCFTSKPRLVYLFESVYREGKLLQDSTFRMARLYHAAGLKPVGDFRLPPDHIAMELEFLAYLHHQHGQALASADDEKAAYARELIAQTLEEHLRPFGAALAGRMDHHDEHPFYRDMARCLAAVLN